MSFNLFGKRKKYPFNKKKDDPARAVYAGPEYYARRNGGVPEDEVLDVYAGPEYFEQPPTPPEEIARVFEEEDAPLPPEEEERFHTVYAGPEPVQETAPDGVGAEPPRERAALVYAGPEFFAKRRAMAQADAIVAGVYAGPEPPTVGMAGISGAMGMMGMPGVPVPQAPPADGGKADGEV